MYLLHYSPDSASLAVRILLAELGVPHRARQIDREAGELASPAYRRLHPLGKIPAIETPDGPMFETAAILLYLADRHGQLAPAPMSPDRAAFLKWLFFTSTNIHPTLLQIFYPDRTAGAGCADAVAAHAHAHMQTLLTALNDMVAAEAPSWLSPHEPSLMDIYVAMLLRWLGSIPAGQPGHFPAQDFPALLPILAALETRPAVQAVAADEGLGPHPFTKP
jgi:glutathione S-transferase